MISIRIPIILLCFYLFFTRIVFSMKSSKIPEINSISGLCEDNQYWPSFGQVQLQDNLPNVIKCTNPGKWNMKLFVQIESAVNPGEKSTRYRVIFARGQKCHNPGKVLSGDMSQHPDVEFNRDDAQRQGTWRVQRTQKVADSKNNPASRQFILQDWDVIPESSGEVTCLVIYDYSDDDDNHLINLKVRWQSVSTVLENTGELMVPLKQVPIQGVRLDSLRSGQKSNVYCCRLSSSNQPSSRASAKIIQCEFGAIPSSSGLRGLLKFQQSIPTANQYIQMAFGPVGSDGKCPDNWVSVARTGQVSVSGVLMHPVLAPLIIGGIGICLILGCLCYQQSQKRAMIRTLTSSDNRA